MKTFSVVGKNKKKVAELVKRMQKLGFKRETKIPGFVVSYGGDGTFLHSERLYPKIPKLLVRENSICYRCNNMLLGQVLERISKGHFKIKEHKKLEAGVAGKRLLATNDIIIRNSFPGHAIRFSVSVDERKFDMLIGDGVVVATELGSTGYFKSITGSYFKDGVGIAFNNLVEDVAPVITDGSKLIQVKIERGDAVVVADNNPKVVKISRGSSVKIRQSKKVARIITL